MIVELLLACRWIMAGEFNMVEARLDKTNPCGRLIAARERLMFNNLKTQLKVDDNPRSQGTLRYSWDNQHMDGSRIFAWLDRIYMFQPIPGESHRHILDYRIPGLRPWSDHHPIVAQLKLTEGATRKS